jgi:hypothetical protein
MVFDQDYCEVKRYQEAFESDPEQSYEGVDAAKIAAEILTVRWAGAPRERSLASPGRRHAGELAVGLQRLPRSPYSGPDSRRNALN